MDTIFMQIRGSIIVLCSSCSSANDGILYSRCDLHMAAHFETNWQTYPDTLWLRQVDSYHTWSSPVRYIRISEFLEASRTVQVHWKAAQDTISGN